MRYAIAVILILLVGISSSFIGCSKGNSPLIPNEKDSVISEPVEYFDDSIASRTVLSVYDATIDPITKILTIQPSSRSADYHFPLTSYFPNVLTIVGYGWTPNFWADIKLTHPFPGSGIDGFDPRAIAILPARAGVSFYYPIFNCVGNNSVVMEPDGYTKLFDNLGGSIPGNTNPFKAYFKDKPYRLWSSTGATEETQRWQMDINGFGGPLQFKLVVDVSTNYPNPPTPVTDNAPEPVQIETFIDQGMTSSGGTASIEVTFLDWQGPYEIETKVECPQLFNSAIQLFYEAPGPNPNEYSFAGTIPNELIAPEGEYHVLIAAWDVPSDPDIHVFNEAKAIVEDDIVFNPVDVTPEDLHPGLGVSNVQVLNGYAYICEQRMGVEIIDIEPPESAHIVNNVELPDYAWDINVSDGYVYVADQWSGLQIIDVDPPESASIVKIVDTASAAWGIYVSNGYAYVAESGVEEWSGLQVIDADPPELAYVLRSITTPYCAQDVHGVNEYVCVANYYSLIIMDIDPPYQTHIVNSVDLPGVNFIRQVFVSNGYAYATGDLFIFDVEPLDSAYLVKYLNSPDYPENVYVLGGYAYVAARNTLQIVDVMPPDMADIVQFIDPPGSAKDVFVLDGYAYVAAVAGGLRIIKLW